MEIPQGQAFIITMIYVSNYEDIEVFRDGEPLLTTPMIYHDYTRTGQARLRVEGGATLSVGRSSTWGTEQYYLQGYLAQPGGPERFVHDTTPGGGTHTVWTAEADRDFVVRTMMVDTSWCNFALDGVAVSVSSFPFSGGIFTGLGVGLGTFVIPAGSELTLTHGLPDDSCTYFIEGTYIQP